MKIPDDLRGPLDIKKMFVSYAGKHDVPPEEVEEAWEAFKRWYLSTLTVLWRGKFRTFLGRRKTPEGPPREKTLPELLAGHPEGVPVDVLHRLLHKPTHEVREALQVLEAQGKAFEVGYDTWSVSPT